MERKFTGIIPEPRITPSTVVPPISEPLIAEPMTRLIPIIRIQDKIESRTKEYFLTKYDTIREVGSGAFGKVYEVKEKATGVTMALKIIKKKPDEQLEKFTKQILGEFNLRTVLQAEGCIRYFLCYHEVGLVKIKNDYEAYLVMEYFQGYELFDCIVGEYKEQKLPPLTNAHKKHISNELIEAVNFLQRHNLVHRDIKPENILYRYNEDPLSSRVKLIDFGLACHLNPQLKLPQCIKAAGSLTYSSPKLLEYYSQHKALTPEMWLDYDRWSLGAVIWILWTGLSFPRNHFVHNHEDGLRYVIREFKIRNQTLSSADQDFFTRFFERSFK